MVPKGSCIILGSETKISREKWLYRTFSQKSKNWSSMNILSHTCFADLVRSAFVTPYSTSLEYEMDESFWASDARNLCWELVFPYIFWRNLTEYLEAENFPRVSRVGVFFPILLSTTARKRKFQSSRKCNREDNFSFFQGFFIKQSPRFIG